MKPEALKSAQRRIVRFGKDAARLGERLSTVDWEAANARRAEMGLAPLHPEGTVNVVKAFEYAAATVPAEDVEYAVRKAPAYRGDEAVVVLLRERAGVDFALDFRYVGKTAVQSDRFRDLAWDLEH